MLANNGINDGIGRIQNAYAETGKIKRFFNAILIIAIASPLLLAVQFSFILKIISYFLKPEQNETKLLAWPKNIIRGILGAILYACIVASVLLIALPVLCLYLLNYSLATEIQLFERMWEIPEEELDNVVGNILGIVPQTTHNPRAVSSVNLSVDRLIERYKGKISKEEFYRQLDRENTNEIEKYIKLSDEFDDDKKSNAFKCLKFINNTTGNSFKDSYSKLTLKQIAILCWKACEDKNIGMEGQSTPLSDEDIKNRKDMFIRGLIDAATTYGNGGQSCAGGTFNKMVESLAGLHPLVVITLNKQKAIEMIKETITQGFPGLVRENLKNLPAKERKAVREELNELPIISPLMARFIITAFEAVSKQCDEFKSTLGEDTAKEVVDTCISNLSCVSLEDQTQTV